MSKWDKILEKVMDERGTFDANTRFTELVGLLERLGYDKEQDGTSHAVFRKNGIIIANLQRVGKGMAKVYQVEQVRAFLRMENF